MSGSGAAPGTSVVSKVSRILDAFSGNRTSLSLSDLARAAGLSPSTIHRLVGELVAWGALERTSDGTYTVGLRLWEIAARTPGSNELRERAMPFLVELLEITRQHVQLAVISDKDALLIEKLSSPYSVETIGRVGGRLPLHASAVGKVLLAASSTEFQSGVLSQRLVAYTPHTLTSRRALLGEIGDIRDRGFGLSTEEMSIGAVSCAAAIVPHANQVVGAISVVMPTAAGPPRRWAQAVMNASWNLSRALASSPRGTQAISAQLTGRRAAGRDRT